MSVCLLCMYVCIYVCMYVYMYVCMCVCVCVCVCVCDWVSARLRVCIILSPFDSNTNKHFFFKRKHWVKMSPYYK